jgi:hypothetical protein
MSSVRDRLGAWFRERQARKPIIVVSGLPRSGTSMMMNMLEAGGVELLVDGVRRADGNNPRGYFEFEPVKDLDRDGDASWLERAPGKAIKVISYLLPKLPEAFTYHVIFMNRDLSEILASQRRMLIDRSQPVSDTSDEQMLTIYEAHLENIRQMMTAAQCFTTLYVDHRALIDHPADQARRVNAFLGGHLHTDQMARVPELQLYRNRAEP